MTDPEARPAAPIVWHDDRSPMSEAQLSTLGPELGSTKMRERIAEDGAWGEVLGRPPGQLWRREAERDVQAHGEPTPARYSPPARGLFVYADLTRARIEADLERRRPAMRAARAELDALRAPLRWVLGADAAFESAPTAVLHLGPGGAPMPTRRLDPEPSSMARTGLALGLAFTTSHCATSGRYGQPSTDPAPGA